MSVSLRAVAASAILALTCPIAAGAAVVASFSQQGGDVVFAFEGSLDISDSFDGSSFVISQGGIRPDRFFGSRNGAFTFRDFSGAFAGPGAIGTSTTIAETATVSGDTFFLNFATELVGIETGYTSGTQIAGSATWAGTTLAALGLAEGRYVWTVGQAEDTITLNVGAPSAVIPLPASGVLLLGALAGGAALRRRRSRS